VDPDPVLPLHFIVTLNVVILLCYPLAPWYGQRMFAARSEKVAFAAVGIAALVTTLLYACGQVATLIYHGHHPGLQDPDQAVGGAMNLFLGPGVRGLMLAMLFAVCQTTMSSIWNTTSAMIVQDFYKGWIRPEATDADQLRVGRRITLVMGLITLLLCTTLLGKLLVVINLFGNTLFAAMFFPCVFGFLWWKASRRAATVCLVLGWILGLAVAIYANVLADPVVPYPVWARWIYVYLMPGICLLGLLISHLDRPSSEEIRRRVAFFRRVGAPWVGARDFASHARRSDPAS
jgi:SSS family solute:Na+ symporter